MAEPHIDTNILVRYLTGDDPEKQARAAALLEKVEKEQLMVIVPISVITETVFVLSSPRLYHLPRSEVVGLLTPLLKLPKFRVRNRRILTRALDLFLTTRLNFGDAYIAASMLQAKAKTIYSWDKDFDQVLGITRIEP